MAILFTIYASICMIVAGVYNSINWLTLFVLCSIVSALYDIRDELRKRNN